MTATAVTVAASLALGMAVSTRAGLTALTAMGGTLACLGLLWGAGNLRSEHRTLSENLQKIRDITFSDLDRNEQERQREAVMPPSSTSLDALYLRETVRMYVVQQAYDNLGVPAGLAVLGLLAGTTGGIWSLWL
ncbi:hypothetical protein [Streptomyces bullii]|uniref:SMODS and SLOG-associating 2TM effector domain-containing protein n=1 Tax=Streptomyces bullii TaxID=349910 RepID=A0ABW0V428_9ACTN